MLCLVRFQPIFVLVVLALATFSSSLISSTYPTLSVFFYVFFFQARIETDPADRTQLRMTVGSGDPTLTFEYDNSASFHELNLSNTATYA